MYDNWWSKSNKLACITLTTNGKTYDYTVPTLLLGDLFPFQQEFKNGLHHRQCVVLSTVIWQSKQQEKQHRWCWYNNKLAFSHPKTS